METDLQVTEFKIVGSKMQLRRNTDMSVSQKAEKGQIELYVG